MKRLKFALLLVTALFLVSCAYDASFVKVSYDVLSVSGASYDTFMKTAAGLYSRGLIDGEEKDKIISLALIYHSVHNTAVEAVAKYEESKDKKDKELIESQLSLVSEALTKLLNALKPHLEKL